MNDYRYLKAWQEAESLCIFTYDIINALPMEERFALGDQMRRSCVSILSNIAEGSRMSDKSFIHYLKIAHGSAAEIEAQLAIAQRLKFASGDKIKIALEKADHVSRLIFLLKRFLERRSACPQNA